MIIQYANGKTIEGVALSRTESTMRVALRGYEDVIELVRVHGHWISEDWEPVQLQPSWRVRRPLPPLSEAEFVCSREVASRLVGLLRHDPANDGPAAEFQAVEAWPSCRLM